MKIIGRGAFASAAVVLPAVVLPAVLMAAVAVSAWEPPGADARGVSQPIPMASSEHRVLVTVDEKGFHPSRVEATAGRQLSLAFKRTSDQGCGQEVVFPDRKIRKKLPLNQEVVVKLTPKRDERIAFTCGMGMYRGSVVAVEEKRK